MRHTSRSTPRRALLASGLLLSLTACHDTVTHKEVMEDRADMSSREVSDAPDAETLPPLPDTPELSLAWSTFEFCPESWNAPDSYTQDHVTLTTLEHEGLTREVAHLVYKGPFLSAPNWPSALATVTIDARSGEEISCDPLEHTAWTLRSATVHSPTRGLTLFHINTTTFHEEPDFTPPQTVQYGVYGTYMSSDTPDLTYIDPKAYSSTDAPKLAFAQRQLVTLSGSELHSMDLDTGDSLWRLALPPTAAGRSVSGVTRIWTPTPDRLFVSRGAHLFELSPEGTPTLRFSSQAEEFSAVMLVAGKIVLVERAPSSEGPPQLTVRDDWGSPPIHHEERCDNAFTLSPTRIGCIEKDREHRRDRIVTFELDGSYHTENTFSCDIEGTTRSSCDPFMLPLSSHHIAFFSKARARDDTTFQRIQIIDLDSPERRATLDIPDPTSYPLDDLGLPSFPLLTSQGILILPSKGYLVGIQTNIPPRDLGPYPRGARLGGNQNLGHALPATSTKNAN